MSCLCYILSFGFPARMVLHTGLVPELRRRGMAVSAICPGADEPELKALAQRLSVTLHGPPEIQRLGREYLAARRYLFEDVRRNPALLARHLRDLERPALGPRPLKCRLSSAARRFQRRGLYLLNRVMCRSLSLAALAAAGERLFLRSAGLRELLLHIRPDVLVSTYPINALEATAMSEARRLGITTVTQLLSWDNITSKGRFPVVADYYLSWGPIMTQELREYYAVGPERIFETGVAHFDAQSKLADVALRRKLLCEMGLDPAHPYLLFGMSSPFFAPHEIDIVEELARWVNGDDLGRDLNLVVRPHPQNVQGSLADPSWLPRLRALQCPRVGLFWPKLADSKLAWALERDDLPALASIIAGCAVNLNSYSTFAIDGLVHNKPVVLTLFDAGFDLPWHRSGRRGAEFLHIRSLIEKGGLSIAFSAKELRDILKYLLANPEADSAARRAALLAECGPLDGRVVHRIAEALSGIASRSLPGGGRNQEETP